jgi:hypothetical protein
MISLPRVEQTVLAPALLGAASLAACLQLFRLYPLAVTGCRGVGVPRSMVLVDRGVAPTGPHVLTQVSECHFDIRSWNGHNWVSEEIRTELPVSRIAHRAVTAGMPVPRDGALLGWVTDSTVSALLSVRCAQPQTPAGPAVVPEIRVMPLTKTTDTLDWPPFTSSPLDDGRLWQYVGRGSLVDVEPLLTRRARQASWVPFPGGRGARHHRGCVVVTSNLHHDDYWLPAGVYLDHWILREGIQAPPAGLLLALPGAADLANRPAIDSDQG